VCVTSEVRGVLFIAAKLGDKGVVVTRKDEPLQAYATSSLASTPHERASSEADKGGRAASPRPAGLGVVPPVHRLRVDASDHSRRSVLLAVCSNIIFLGQAASLGPNDLPLAASQSSVAPSLSTLTMDQS